PGRSNRVRPETQVRDRRAAGLLRVIDEVRLRVTVLAQDLDGVLVRADRAVRADAVEHGAHGIAVLDVQPRVVVDGGAGDVVGDADGEPARRFGAGQCGEHTGHHAGRELLRGKAVPATR